jgi:Ni/Co efflux regulator RcnB
MKKLISTMAIVALLVAGTVNAQEKKEAKKAEKKEEAKKM